MKILIQNGRVIDPASGLDQICDVAVAAGRIVGLGRAPADFAPTRTIDASGCIVLPGLVDLAARLREPGHEHEGMLESEMAAAVAGGVTSLVCPPDTDPVLDEPGLVEMLKFRAEKLHQSRLFPLGALTRGLAGEVLTEMAELTESGCVGFGQAEVPLASTQVLQRALQYAATYGYTVWLRPQEMHLGKGVAASGPLATRLGLSGVPVAAETIALHTIFELLKTTGARVHLCRLSSAAGVELVPGPGLEAVRIADEPAHLASRLSRTATGLELRSFAQSSELERAVPLSDLLGDPPHGFVIEAAEELLLVPFVEPLNSGQKALLLQHARLQIPDAEVPAFAAQFYPPLRRLTAVVADADVALPEPEPPRLLLRVAFLPDHVSELRWAVRYRVGEGALDVGLDPGHEPEPFRDLELEAGLFGALPSGPWPSLTVGEVRRPVETASITGPETAQLAELWLDRLRALGVLVEVTGRPADYRLATEAPEVTLSVTDPPEGADWFNLGVRVSIEGEPVEYRELFYALATGQTHLILPSEIGRAHV